MSYSEKALVEKKLLEKEAAIEKLSTEMKTAVSKLELEIKVLRDRNNELVSDLSLIKREQQLNEERIETEKVQLKTKAVKTSEDHNNEVTTLISNHDTQLSNYRERNEAALKKLEREKSDILEGK